jgi:hypothetical protein
MNDPDKIINLMDRLRKGEPDPEAPILPLVDPAEAIAIALSMTQPGPARLISPEGPMVRHVMLAIKLAGYKVVPR